MKLLDRERVEGMNITIGRRVHYRQKGPKVSAVCAAEYRDDLEKQRCDNLGTRSRLEARRMAISIFN